MAAEPALGRAGYWLGTGAAVELGMLQRLLDTVSLTGGQWVVVIALSLLAPAVVAADKAIQLWRQRKARASATTGKELRTKPAIQASA